MIGLWIILSIYFGENKTKCILLAQNLNLIKSIDLILDMRRYTLRNITQWQIFFCSLDETLSGESMALKVLNKINSRLRFLYKKHMFLSPPHLTCILLPHFDYACSAWYSNFSKRLNSKLKYSKISAYHLSVFE